MSSIKRKEIAKYQRRISKIIGRKANIAEAKKAYLLGIKDGDGGNTIGYKLLESIGVITDKLNNRSITCFGDNMFFLGEIIN